jgi:hypothetical protein
MREIMRSLLSSNLLVTGILMFIGSIITFAGSTFLLNATNVGKRLGFFDYWCCNLWLGSY